jgi:hypothetical protein
VGFYIFFPFRIIHILLISFFFIEITNGGIFGTPEENRLERRDRGKGDREDETERGKEEGR